MIEQATRLKDSCELSIVVPFYNEESVLPAFHKRLIKVLNLMSERCEVIYVNDGSSDLSQQLVESFFSHRNSVYCINLSRNFGKEAAMSAGLDHSTGKAVILIDADLQDPPELIPMMLKHWRAGNDIVNMQRTERHGESWFKRVSAAAYYKLLNRLADNDIPENVGDFRLLDRKVVDNLVQLKERNRYMKGLFTWSGFRQITIPFERDPRLCGDTKWNYFKLIGLAVDGITSFSIRPLRLATFIGVLVAMAAFVYGLVIVSKTLILGESVSGYPSMMVVMLALGGVQLITIGFLGEYIGRIFVESKQRPIYVVRSVSGVAKQRSVFLEAVNEKQA